MNGCLARKIRASAHDANGMTGTGSMFLKKKWRKKPGKYPMADKEPSNDPRRECTVQTLDTWHSRYIRLRDTDSNGICRCFTCSSWVGHPKDCTNGHYIKRDRYSVKYHERNVHAQCLSCNGFEDGRQGRYAINLDTRYGRGTAAQLEALGSRRGKLKAHERYIVCQQYKDLVRHELARTGLEPWWKK